MNSDTFVSSSLSCSSVTRNFSAKIPMILFSIQDFDCELSLSNEHAYMTSLLLRDYYLLDQRVQTLAVAIRLWASLCKVDRPAEGTLPAHSFSLLLVFFLQQESKPVLPCLHDSLKSRNPETYSSQSHVCKLRCKSRSNDGYH